jgi:hypothetical protein
MVATKPPSGDGQSPRPRLKRDEKLWSLLPAIDAPYDYHSLSRAETDAIVEALGDGFGERLGQGRQPLPLPSNVKSGLLDHAFHFYSGYDADERDDAFWSWDDDAPPPYEWFPLEFSPRRLRIYFENQFQRFCKQIAREKVVHRLIAKHSAGKRLYQKPWYEFHALQFLGFIEMSVEQTSKHPAVGFMLIAGFAGQLGRLVEQYYGRFRFERAAVAGESARKGASTGARSRLKRTGPNIPRGRMRL